MITSGIAELKFGEPNASFEREHMTILDVPQPILDRIKALPKRIYLNKQLKEPLLKAFHNLITHCCEEELKTWDGCFNVRKMRGLTAMSLHSWGIAIDVNAKENPLNATPVLSRTFVKCFEDAGFDWGGRWKRKDGMHFQLKLELLK